MKSPGPASSLYSKLLAPTHTRPARARCREPFQARRGGADRSWHREQPLPCRPISLLAPVRACVMAAALVMPGVCGVLLSNVPARTILTPCSFQSMVSILTRRE